jgi:hypothetical protein
MVWKGEELRSPMDYFAAMSAVRDPDEAREFLETWEQEHDTARRTAGYLTGYATVEEGDRLRQLFGIEHPIVGDLERPLNFDELLTLGMEFQKAQLNGDDFEAAAIKAREGVRALRWIREGQRDGATD